MRSLLALILVVQLAFQVQGQSFLTNAEVYNYEVGDVFQSRGQGFTVWGSSPPADYTDTITAKWVSASQDTLFYALRHWVVIYQMSPDIPPVVEMSDDTLIVTELDQPATQFIATDPCPPVLDSMGLDPALCGRNSWWMFSAGDTCTWGYTGSSSQVIAGCGGPYFSTMDDQGGGGNYWLTYFHRSGAECGVFHDLPNGMAGHDNPELIRVFPNPTSGLIRISDDGVKELIVQNAIGKVLNIATSGPLVDLGEQPRGIYFVTGNSRAGHRFRARVVKD
jgi:hypothetical protein